MKGPEQLPDEGQVIKTDVGTGLSSTTKVKAEVTGISSGQIAYKVIDIIDEGDTVPDEGEIFGSDTDGFIWETV